eukprot:6135013-Alexandrium_andersonii.AAC.1
MDMDGGKCASLVDMMSQPSDGGVRVSGGFSTTSVASEVSLDKSGINDCINGRHCDESIHEDVDKLAR